MMQPATVMGFLPLHGIMRSAPACRTAAAMRRAATIVLLP
jgi:hypothetical protein